MEIDSTGLLHCPFCGDTARLISAYTGFFVSCSGCECDVGMFEFHGETRGEFDTKEEAAAAWNRRVHTPAIPEMPNG